jgi:erythromycin esterase
MKKQIKIEISGLLVIFICTFCNNQPKVNVNKLVNDVLTHNILKNDSLQNDSTSNNKNRETLISAGEKVDLKAWLREPTPDELNWLRQNIYPLKTYNPNSISNEDLKILIKLIGNSRVVALGETTHGSSEIFKMKHRIIKYLAENDGFDLFSIEANMPESYKLNEYIIEGKGDPTDLIKGMYFWTWRTQEVLNMVEWMRNHNKSENKIYFTGFDMQFYFGAIQELSEAFKNDSEIQEVIKELKSKLDELKYVSQENKSKLDDQLNRLHDFISKSDYPSSKKNWLFQNIRIIEQYLENSSRDKYMAENLLWIKSQNPDSKIIVWAHNGHIKKTGTSMGKYLSDSLKNNYLTIGFTFYKGNYTAVGTNGLTNYLAQEAYPGTYEYYFNAINEPIFLLDLRQVKNQKSLSSKWLLGQLSFRTVGAMKTYYEFYDTDLTADFDLVIFINESTNSKLLE